MKKLLILVLFCAILIGWGATARAQSAGRMPSFSALRDGWNVLTPGGRTRCADGSPYRFIVRPGASNRLLIYFQGGGACWDTNTCIGLAAFDPNVNDETWSDPPPPPAFGDGIFDLDNPDNPFRDYTIVYVPYCSADFHMGNRAVNYPTTPGNTVLIQHRGAVNAGAALDWIRNTIRSPESIFMTGCSAGGPAAIFHAPTMLARYPGVPLVMMSESAGGYEGDLSALFSTWGTVSLLPRSIPGFSGVTANTMTFETLFTAIGGTYSGNRLVQFNSTADSIQGYYLSLMGTPAERYTGALLGNLLALHTTMPNFRSYTASGDVHCITPRNEFYSLSVNGVRIRDWVAALARSEDVGNVYPDGFNLWFTPPS